MPTVKHVAVLNDVHGNLPALEAVLAELDDEPVDAVVCGGDVLWGAYQAECLALLRDRRAQFLTGNCERSVLLGADDQTAWCGLQLSPDQRAFVGSWPGTVQLDVDGLGRVLLCHGSPRSDEEILTVATPDETAAEAIVEPVPRDEVVAHFERQAGRGESS